jgi:hypothetical protein
VEVKGFLICLVVTLIGGTLDHALTQTVEAMRILDRHFYVWRLRFGYPEILSRIDASSMLGLDMALPSLPNQVPLPSPYLSRRGETQKIPTKLSLPLDLTPLSLTLEDTIPHNYFLFQVDCHVRAVIDFASKTIDQGTLRQQRARARRRHCCGNGQSCFDDERSWPCCFPPSQSPPSMVSSSSSSPNGEAGLPPSPQPYVPTKQQNDNSFDGKLDAIHDGDEENGQSIWKQRSRRCCHRLLTIFLQILKSLIIDTFRPLFNQSNEGTSIIFMYQYD